MKGVLRLHGIRCHEVGPWDVPPREVQFLVHGGIPEKVQAVPLGGQLRHSLGFRECPFEMTLRCGVQQVAGSHGLLLEVGLLRAGRVGGHDNYTHVSYTMQKLPDQKA